MIAAVSNIAWSSAEDAEAETLLREMGVGALELAPTRYWPDLSAVSETEARTAAEGIQARGFRIAAFQAVLFGQPHLQILGKDDGKRCGEYLAAVCRLAGWMGAQAVVLGAPKNRLRGDLSGEAVATRAVPFFQRLGEAAVNAGTTLCLEPNPAVYGGDFLLDVPETAALVQAVDSPGIALNFDMGEQAIHQADTPAMLREFGRWICHFHVSEPLLEPFDPGRPAHRQAADTLREIGYSGAISLEMKAPAGGLAAVRKALHGMLDTYQP